MFLIKGILSKLIFPHKLLRIDGSKFNNHNGNIREFGETLT